VRRIVLSIARAASGSDAPATSGTRKGVASCRRMRASFTPARSGRASYHARALAFTRARSSSLVNASCRRSTAARLRS
jgi:hypothetical protein